MGPPPPFDLFEILGIDGKENRYTDLLAWFCGRPDGRGEVFAHRLLRRVQPAGFLPDPMGPLREVRREVVTRGGRIDLVLEFERCALAVEVKTWSSEHDTPGAQPQTMSYPTALSHELEQSGRPKPVLCILLSPAGTPPLGIHAARLSFLDLATALLDERDAGGTEEERLLYRLFAAHMLDLVTWAMTGHSFQAVEQALARPREARPSWLTHHVSAFARLAVAMEVPSR